ncbi:hypothetical protein PENSUB_1666, partial [Penicillium subrubescens]
NNNEGSIGSSTPTFSQNQLLKVSGNKGKVQREEIKIADKNDNELLGIQRLSDSEVAEVVKKYA